MADVQIDVSGEMTAPPDPQPKAKQFSFLQFPAQIPDPKDWLQQQRQNVRPWLVFVQTSNFRVPPSLPRLGRRAMRNVEYFQSNYVFVFLGLVAYCLLTTPLVLFAILGTLYAGYRLSQRHRERRCVVFGRELTLAQQYGLLAGCSVPIYYAVGAHAAMFWVLGASFFVVALHAAFYNIDALVAEEESYLITQDV